MSQSRIFGLILMVAGIVLFIIGMNSSHSVNDQISNAVTGRFTDHTTWYIVGGLVSGITGISILLFGPREKGA